MVGAYLDGPPAIDTSNRYGRELPSKCVIYDRIHMPRVLMSQQILAEMRLYDSARSVAVLADMQNS
jgi:hypothetical protein